MIRSGIKYLFVLGYLPLLLSCKGKHELSPQAYVGWVEDPANGLKVERKMDVLSYSVQYKPLAYIIAKEEKSNSIEKTKLESRKRTLEKMQYYTLRIASNGGNDLLTVNSPSQQEYYQRQNYLTYELQSDIALVDGLDTLSCGLFQAVGNYGLAPYMDFVLGFETKDASQHLPLNDKEFILHDKVFGNGILKFTIKKENINKLPEIITL
jgi:hypothetical protein